MAIWAAVIGGGLSLLGGIMGGKSSKNSAPAGSNTPGFYDPYSQYRPQAATELNDLMNNPQTVQQTPEYASMLEAASRASVAQGYNGSGNAIVAAANAGGQAYQQAFNNLAMLSGANMSPATGAAYATQQGNYNQQMNQQMWGGLGSIFGRMAGSTFGGGSGGGGYSDGSGAYSFNGPVMTEPAYP